MQYRGRNHQQAIAERGEVKIDRYPSINGNENGQSRTQNATNPIQGPVPGSFLCHFAFCQLHSRRKIHFQYNSCGKYDHEQPDAIEGETIGNWNQDKDGKQELSKFSWFFADFFPAVEEGGGNCQSSGKK